MTQELINQILSEKMSDTEFRIFCAALLTIISGFIAILRFKYPCKEYQESGDFEDFFCPIFLLSTLIFLVGCGCVLESSYDLYRTRKFPQVYIDKYIRLNRLQINRGDNRVS